MGVEKRQGTTNLYKYGKKRGADGKVSSVYLGKHAPDELPKAEGAEPPAVEAAPVAQTLTTGASVSRHPFPVRLAFKKRHGFNLGWLLKAKTGAYDEEIDADLAAETAAVAQG